MPAPIMNYVPDLPAKERADVRYRCGFGCVRCGVTIYEYLTLPVVSGHRQQASSDDSVTLLCPPCHELVETERLTPAQVHIFHSSPIARQRHFSRDRLPFTNELPTLTVGGSRAVRDTPIPIALAGELLLLFAPPRNGVGATRISVRLGDSMGNPVDIVDGNEWLIRDGSWAFAYRGDRYCFFSTRNDSLAILRIVMRNKIAVEHLRTTIRGRRVEVTQDWIQVDSVRFVDRVVSGQLIGLDL